MKHLKKFQHKYNISTLTLALLVVFAVQNNVLSAMSLYPGL